MSRHRPEWWPENGSLLHMAETIHGVFTGCVEPSPDRDELYAKCLRFALDNWKTPECEFDVYVRMMLGRAVAEYGYHVNSLRKPIKEDGQ